MKTFVRLIRRYVLAAVGIVLLLLFSGVAVLGWLGWQEGCSLPQREYSSGEIADSMVETAEGLAFGAERTPQEWMNGYEWAMVLDDVGNIRWSYGLPQELNHAYTPGDIAQFARWYLADYPVFCWTEPYGLFVIGLPRGSLWKYSIYSSPDFALSIVRVLPAAALGMLLLGLALCFWLSWRGAKRLETVANGLEALAQGQTVRLSTDGFAGELAEKLNRIGAQLQAKNEMLSRRDNARTQWIAGVSHDVRTPLALILGWAEQLEQDALLPDSSRQKATGIRTQCEKLRTLIDDLNLTSKLEYGAQPLRRKDLRAGPLFRQLVAQFCESPLAEHCEITLEQEEPAEQTVLSVDEALLARLLENLMNNSVRHNPKPVNITVHTRQVGERFCLTVADDGIGYPAAVLVALNAAEPAENAPHILGLYVVRQIAAAQGAGLTALARANEISRTAVLRLLDVGAQGVVVPCVETVEEVRELVRYAKFAPLGNRGFCPTRDGGWGHAAHAVSISGYMETSNRETLLLPQCETVGCLEHIEEITAMDGVDGIFVGPFDLSIALGHPGEFNAPVVHDAILRVQAACKRSGKLSIIFTGSAAASRQRFAEGFDSVTMGMDSLFYVEMYKNLVADVWGK